MHRPGPEMNVVDPGKRIAEIGSYGDPAVVGEGVTAWNVGQLRKALRGEAWQ